MNNNRFVLIPIELLRNIQNLIKGTRYEDEVKKILESREVIENQDVTKLPKEGHVKRVIDGDTVELQNGLVFLIISPGSFCRCRLGAGRSRHDGCR